MSRATLKSRFGLIVALLALHGCSGGSGTGANSSATPSASRKQNWTPLKVNGASSTKSLSAMAAGCHSKDLGLAITFSDAPISKENRLTHAEVCAIEVQAANTELQSRRNTEDQFCAVYKEKFFRYFGVDNWSDAVGRAESLPEPRPDGWDRTVAIFRACADPDKFLQLAIKDTHIRIFSIGSVTAVNHECLAYLLEQRTATSANDASRFYSLHGSKECADITSDVPPGDLIISKYHYTGALPSDYEIHGSTHAFVSSHQDRVESAGRAILDVAGTPTAATSASDTAIQQAEKFERTHEYGKALELLKPLAEQGNSRAELDLGTMYGQGQGVTKDDAQAVVWYRKAADQGNSEAQFNLGWNYGEGQGVTKDDAQAAVWYRKAADQGNATAQNNLGYMYEHGRGVAEDDAQAAIWYRKAADQGDESAQFSLAYMYERGRGVVKDREQAVAWYRKAADQGNAVAQEHLRIMAKQAEEARIPAAQARMDYPQGYAAAFAESMSHGGACDSFSEMIIRAGNNTRYPENVRVAQIDSLVRGATQAHCVPD
jgi:TPR repeat protein